MQYPVYFNSALKNFDSRGQVNTTTRDGEKHGSVSTQVSLLLERLTLKDKC